MTKPHLKKLDDRATPAVFIGYEQGSKAWRFYDPSTHHAIVSRDAVFEEHASWDWNAGITQGSPANYTEFHVEHLAEDVILDDAPNPGVSPPHGGASPAPPPLMSPPPATPSPATPVFVSPTTGATQLLDSGNDVMPRFRTIDNLVDYAAPPGPAQRNLDEALAEELHLQEPAQRELDEELLEEILLQIAEEPTTFAEAEQDQSLRRAMIDEMQSIEGNQTWRLVTLPSGHRPVGLKWVYKVKKNAAGKVIKHKARLVAKAYVQQPGVDYDEAFAPVARIESVPLLLALTAQEGWEVHHMDVKSAFLNGELPEEVYVKQPDGFVVEGQEDKVLCLDKALYGLRQAPRAWNTKLDQTLVALQFQRSVSDHSVYARGQGAHRLLVGVYVDDLVITGSSNSEIGKFKLEMKAKFQMSDLGVALLLSGP